jgi:hypothetical protein
MDDQAARVRTPTTCGECQAPRISTTEYDQRGFLSPDYDRSVEFSCGSKQYRFVKAREFLAEDDVQRVDIKARWGKVEYTKNCLYGALQLARNGR